MVCLRDIKRLTKKKVMDLQPIYKVIFKLNIDRDKRPYIVIYSGKTLEYMIDHFFLYDDRVEFTTIKEAQDYIMAERKGAYSKPEDIPVHECDSWEKFKERYNIKEPEK